MLKANVPIYSRQTDLHKRKERLKLQNKGYSSYYIDCKTMSRNCVRFKHFYITFELLHPPTISSVFNQLQYKS